MAICPFAVQKIIPLNTTSDPKIEMRAAVLHVDAGNATSLFGLFTAAEQPGGSGVEAHFFVVADGTIEQYRDTDYQADAAYASNDFAIHIETQGYGAGPWTPAQIKSIKRLLVWIHETHPKVPYRKIQHWNGAGIGYHSQFPEWNKSNHSCPGPDRIVQFDKVLVPWINSQNWAAPVEEARGHLRDAQIALQVAVNQGAGLKVKTALATVASVLKAL